MKGRPGGAATTDEGVDLMDKVRLMSITPKEDRLIASSAKGAKGPTFDESN